MRRPLAGAVVIAVVLGAFASGASASTSTRTLKVSATPTNAGTPNAPTAASLSLRLLTTSDDGTVPAVGAHDDIYVAKGFKINQAAFAKCSATVLNDLSKGPAKCPAGSLVGGGNASAYAAPCTTPTPTGNAVRADVKVRIYNAGGGALNAFLSTETPVRIAQTLRVTIRKSTGLFGLKLSFDVPESVQMPVPGVCAALFDVTLKVNKVSTTKRVTVGGRKVTKRINFLETTACTGRKWNFRDDVRFRDGTRGSGKTSVACHT